MLQIQIAAAVLLALLLRCTMKKLPKVYSYFLWLLVFVRLLCPVALETDFGLAPSREESVVWIEQALPENRFFTAAGQPQTPADIPSDSMPEETNARQEDGIPAGEAGPEDSLRVVLSIVWALGAATVLGYNGFALLRIRKRLQWAWLLSDNVYVCPGICVPFTLGIIRPKIYLPEELKEGERAYIICHEQVHIRRKDYLVKDLAFLLTALYWFNPFVWIAFYFLERDMEMSCDEKVLKLMGTRIKREYSQSLLNFAERGNLAVTPLTFGENSVKQRVKNVLTYKNAKRWCLVLGIVILIGAGLVFFTARPDKTPQGTQIPVGTEEIMQETKPAEEPSGAFVTADSVGEVYQEREVTPDQSGEEESYMVQITETGIYRKDRAGLRHLYDGYVSPGTTWTVAENMMYFTGDSQYYDGALDYWEDVVCMLDLDTGEVDKETLLLPEEVQRRAPFRWINVYGGFVFLASQNEPEGYSMPLINTGNTSLSSGHVWKDKAVSALNEEEQNAYGTAIREELLKEPVRVLELSNRAATETYLYIDLDGDGRAERISLTGDPEYEAIQWNYDAYVLRAGASEQRGYAMCLNNGIWPVSLDGETILLALFEDGPSDDPLTTLFAYENGSLRRVGAFADDIRQCIIVDGVINGTERHDVLQSDYVKRKWRLGSTGELEAVPEETYEFVTLNDITLLKPLPVHAAPDISSSWTELKPQTVRFVQTDEAFQWIYAEAKDGTGGWFLTDGLTVTELDLDFGKVFENLLFYD